MDRVGEVGRRLASLGGVAVGLAGMAVDWRGVDRAAGWLARVGFAPVRRRRDGGGVEWGEAAGAGARRRAFGGAGERAVGVARGRAGGGREQAGAGAASGVAEPEPSLGRGMAGGARSSPGGMVGGAQREMRGVAGWAPSVLRGVAGWTPRVLGGVDWALARGTGESAGVPGRAGGGVRVAGGAGVPGVVGAAVPGWMGLAGVGEGRGAGARRGARLKIGTVTKRAAWSWAALGGEGSGVAALLGAARGVAAAPRGSVAGGAAPGGAGDWPQPGRSVPGWAEEAARTVAPGRDAGGGEAAVGVWGLGRDGVRPLVDELARLAQRPPAGVTGFDAARGVAWWGGWTGGA